MTKVFLSYAHLDDNVPREWVTNFSKELAKCAQVYSGKRDFEISQQIFSKEIRTEEIENKIKDELNASDLLIALISPCYLESWWGAFEREYFLRFALKNKDEKVRKNKILNVVKLMLAPSDLDNLTRDLKSNYSYNFCKFHDELGLATTIEPDEKEYGKTILTIANSIAKKLREGKSDKVVRVFVGKTTEDLLLRINRLITELESQKDLQVQIVTAGNFGEKNEVQETDIRELIASCNFSVHIFGSGQGKEISQFQWHVVANALEAGTSNLKMISWVAAELSGEEPSIPDPYNSFLKQHVMNFASINHDYMNRSFEDLLTNLKDQLTNYKCE
jgi:hypothetical protein